MARRELSEINAGSMADIAFLLLIFFLVTTTMDQDQGVNRTLPPMPDERLDETKSIKRNVFEVLVNRNDQLLVEGEYINVNQLKDQAMAFMTNSGVFRNDSAIADPNLTFRIWENMEKVNFQIDLLEKEIKELREKGDPDDDITIDRKVAELGNWKAKIDAVEYFGKYRKLDDAAVISLKSDNSTSYEMYVKVQNELTAALNELRDELTMNLDGCYKPFLELSSKELAEKKIIKAVRQIYPQRISEAEPNK